MNIQQGDGATAQTLINLVLETRDMAASLKVDLARLGEKIDGVKDTVSANRRDSDRKHEALEDGLRAERESLEEGLEKARRERLTALERLEVRVRKLEDWRLVQMGLAGAGGGGVVAIIQALLSGSG